MDTKLIKESIQALIEKYERVKSSGLIKGYTEEETKKDFILPLFKILGWDVDDKYEVSAEETISKDRVDYGFYLNGRIKFYLEAKSLRVDLHKEEFAKQAIQYSWNKGVIWAVLTDFESLIVFNALSPEKSLHGKKYFEIPYNELLVRFDQLWLLSKEAFQNDLLDKEAEKHGKKLQKVTVTDTLAKDLNVCRENLTKAFITWNKEVSLQLIDEGVQKLLDRLIFIRVAEDRGIEPPTLLPLIREWQTAGHKGSPYQAMIQKFRELDEIYDSNLFSKHPFEQWEEYSGATEEVIDILYGKKNYFQYDFAVIPADVLGSVYENYLGYKLEQSKHTTSENDEADGKTKKNLRKRKEHGIYYTPKYIVDYIVKNALGPALETCKSVNDLQKIKVLDPACGSGSFLVAAFNAIVNKYEEFKVPINGLLKIQILQNNIYGVDLDEQAVELARLNLLLQTFDSQFKLPNLNSNIKNGNSLISGSEEELKKYFGKDYRDKKAFNWEEEFPEVFKQGGFDVVIGNPPYISFYSKQSQASSITKQLLEYFIEKYNFIEEKNKLGRYNTLMFFIETAGKIIKENGYVGLIIDTNIHSNPSEQIRKYIIQNFKLIQLVDELKVFNDVTSSQFIFIFNKIILTKDSIVEWKKFDSNFTLTETIKSFQKDINEKNGYSFKIPNDYNKKEIINKITSFPSLVDLVGKEHIRTCITFTGQKDKFVIEKKEKEFDYPLLEGSKSLTESYSTLVAYSYVRYDISLRDRLNKEYQLLAKKENKRSPMVIGLGDLELFKAPKIFIRLSDIRITASFTKDFVCADLSLYILTLPNKKIEFNNLNLLYILGVLNSKLITFYMRISNLIRNLNTGTPQIRLNDLRNIPLFIAKINDQKKIINLVNKIMELKKDLYNYAENSNEWQKLKDEIDRVDTQIDLKVYELYGLTEKEIEIVEKNS